MAWKTFLVKMRFICITMKNHFYINSFALSLPLKQRLGATRKRPILQYLIVLTLTVITLNSNDALIVVVVFPVGVRLFYFCIALYLYGDLAIYAAAVPKSLTQIAW